MKNNWTREETIIAFNVYCKIPFKTSSKTNPTVIKHANLIGRSPSALNMKIGNFGRLDPELKKQGITGLVNGSKLEEDIWNEFHGNWDKLAFESEELIAKYQHKKIEEIDEFNIEKFPEGKDKETKVKNRVNQSFFRSTVLSSYNLKCCVTGLSITDFLVASHIKPWAIDIENRTNPHNGLCLNSIHDTAFDRGFITITPEYKILVSNYFDNFSDEKAVKDFFLKFQNQNIQTPERFLPSKEFLDYHCNDIFKKMNAFHAINIDYLKPSRTVETVLVSNKKSEKVVFVYNYEGVSFRVFDSTISLVNFFNSNTESEHHFNSENELDKFLSTIELK